MLVASYLNRLVLASYRPESIAVKRRVLSLFEQFVAPTPLLAVTRLDVEAFLARDLAPASRRAYLTTLRGLYRWAVDEGFLAVDPTAKLPTIKVPRSTPRPMDELELARALANASARMTCWLLLMSLAGLRCCEVARLRPQDLMEQPGGTLLWLREAKGGQSATVPAHPAILEALALLPIRDGLWWDATPASVSQITNRFLRGVGISSNSHSLRHLSATRWFRASGHDLLTTARLLRHASVSSSQVYAQLDPTRPMEVVNLVHVA